MSKKLIVALAVLSFAFIGTTFAGVENIQVSGDMKVQSILRNLSLGSRETVEEANDHEIFTSQIRLQFDADLTENVAAVLGFISEDVWGDDNTNADDVEIDLGYIELKEFLNDAVSICVGRQNLKYGNALIVGNPDTNQGRIANSNNDTNLPAIAEDLTLRKSFEALKMVVDLAPWTVDLVLAQIDEVTTSLRREDEVLWGMNAAYDWDSYNGVSELYFFTGTRTPRSTLTDDEDNVYVVGTRTQLDPTDKISFGVEAAFQFGNYVPAAGADSQHRKAYALQTDAEYKFLNDYNTKLGIGYTFLSGNKESGTDIYEGWDPLWEDQTPAEIINVLMENSNVHLITVCASMMPREDVTLGVLYAHAELVSKLENAAYWGTSDPNATASLFGGGAGLVTNGYVMNTSNRSFGNEVDAHVIYDYTEDVQLMLKGAMFMPGGVFDYDNNKKAYSLRAGISVDF